ncbi:hypothetical protein GWI34_10575, partial [Actinomadura sp. DSM 109109]|nr:hypothetical protein [Actinomadura lepetitiana]
PRPPEAPGGRRRAPEPPLAWAEDPQRGTQEEPDDNPVDSGSLTTQALPQVTQPRRTGEAPRPAPPGRRGTPQPEQRRRPLPPALDPPSGPGKPVAPKPVSPTEVTQGTGTVRPRPSAPSAPSKPSAPPSPSAPSKPSDTESSEPAGSETDAGVESAATRTQEDISKFMPPELPDDGKDGTPPAGPKDAAPDVSPRYGKKPYKAGRHAGP